MEHYPVRRVRTPNFTGEVVPVRDCEHVSCRLIGSKAPARRIKDDAPLRGARLVSWTCLTTVCSTWARVMRSMEAYDTSEPRMKDAGVLGVDAARYGSDSSVIVSNQG